MPHRLKLIGLALTALLAIGAVLASSALAQFESTKQFVQLSVRENEPQEFRIQGGLTVTCNTLSLFSTFQEGFLEGETFVTEQVSATPLYGGCEPVLGQHTSIDTNQCDFVLRLAKGATTGVTDLECPFEGIEIHIGTVCTYEVGTQFGLGFISYENEEGGTIKISPEVIGISSARTTNDFFCPEAGESGVYEGSATIEGDGGATPIFVD